MAGGHSCLVVVSLVYTSTVKSCPVLIQKTDTDYSVGTSRIHHGNNTGDKAGMLTQDVMTPAAVFVKLKLLMPLTATVSMTRVTTYL